MAAAKNQSGLINYERMMKNGLKSYGASGAPAASPALARSA
jgi:hypothetical protein